ncbi:MAG: HmuY family protein, partial [Chitinophagaceae bacterium]
AYADFSESDITGLTFLSSQTSIGSDWRTTQPAAAKETQYYIIKDGNNNYYKLKFTGIINNGSRGYPSIAYDLIKRG